MLLVQHAGIFLPATHTNVPPGKVRQKINTGHCQKVRQNSVTVFPVAVCENAMDLFSESHIFGHIVKVKGRMKVKLI